MSKEIEASFDLSPMEDEKKSSQELVVIDQTPDQIEQDFDFVRNNLRNILTTGVDSLEEISAVAATSQHPRAYEVVASMIKTLADVNKDLLSIQKTKKELKGESAPTTVNNNLFVSTTAELNKRIEDMRKNNESE